MRLPGAHPGHHQAHGLPLGNLATSSLLPFPLPASSTRTSAPPSHRPPVQRHPLCRSTPHTSESAPKAHPCLANLVSLSLWGCTLLSSWKHQVEPWNASPCKPSLPALLSSYSSSPTRNVDQTPGPISPGDIMSGRGISYPARCPTLYSNCPSLAWQPWQCLATSLTLGMRRVQEPAETSSSDQKNTRPRGLMGVVVLDPGIDGNCSS